MLNIFYGDMKDAVYNTASYFKFDYEDEWITDPFVKEMILDVDKSVVLDSGVIDGPCFRKNTASWFVRRSKNINSG